MALLKGLKQLVLAIVGKYVSGKDDDCKPSTRDCNIRDRRRGMFRLSVLWDRFQSGGH